jgi:uncharacterized protein (DUF885 family)
VVDTGLHHLRWSREQTLRYYMDALGETEDEAATENDRYCVLPGQACGYMVGKITFLRLRDHVKSALASKFDIAEFHQTVLAGGAMPLEALKDEIDRYIARVRSG